MRSGPALVLAASLGLWACGHGQPAMRQEARVSRATAAGAKVEPPAPTSSVVPLDWPVIAPVMSGFGRREGRLHQGIDLRCPDGTAVRAAAAGEVVYAGNELRGYGELLMIRHDARWVTVYAHNQRLLVPVGTQVRRGQMIARSGHSGRASTPHVHFEVRRDGIAQNPVRVLRTTPGSEHH